MKVEFGEPLKDSISKKGLDLLHYLNYEFPTTLGNRLLKEMINEVYKEGFLEGYSEGSKMALDNFDNYLANAKSKKLFELK